ncbi:MAG: agmatinase, partial [Bacillota bacterium]|nr:agmatinase [Bacillota bacterium]
MNFMACEAEYDEAEVVLFGAPFDGTVSYRPGARFGPAAIRTESYGIETYSPYLERDLEELSVFDGGDLELPFGSSRRALDMIRDFTAQVVKDGKLPLMTGGEHLVTLGAVEALAAVYPHLHVLHFDAHADLREEYLGDTLSHACVLRRCHDLLGDNRIFQLGVRSMTAEENAFAKVHVTQHKFDLSKLEEVIGALGNAPVYVTLDLDVLDPAFFPGTGTPEPGGVT